MGKRQIINTGGPGRARADSRRALIAAAIVVVVLLAAFAAVGYFERGAAPAPAPVSSGRGTLR